MKTYTRLAGLLTLLAAFVWGVGCDKQATVQGEGEKALTLTKPGKVTLEQGGTAKLTVKITRKDMTDPIGVSFGKLPAGVTILDGDRKITGDEAEYVLKAQDAAILVKEHQAEVTATGPAGMAVTQQFLINIVEPDKAKTTQSNNNNNKTPPSRVEETLLLAKPAAITLQRGNTATLDVKITRHNLTGPVEVSFDKLPEGVKVVDANQKLIGDEGKFILEADEKAALVSGHAAVLTVKGADGRSVTQPLMLTIKEAS